MLDISFIKCTKNCVKDLDDKLAEQTYGVFYDSDRFDPTLFENWGLVSSTEAIVKKINPEVPYRVVNLIHMDYVKLQDYQLYAKTAE